MEPGTVVYDLMNHWIVPREQFCLGAMVLPWLLAIATFVSTRRKPDSDGVDWFLGRKIKRSEVEWGNLKGRLLCVIFFAFGILYSSAIIYSIFESNRYYRDHAATAQTVRGQIRSLRYQSSRTDEYEVIVIGDMLYALSLTERRGLSSQLFDARDELRSGMFVEITYCPQFHRYKNSVGIPPELDLLSPLKITLLRLPPESAIR